MEIGVVKWFNNAKGFGFISAEGVDTDIFAHYSAIEMDGYRSLKAGQRVQFEVIHGDKGSHATKIYSDCGIGETLKRFKIFSI